MSKLIQSQQPSKSSKKSSAKSRKDYEAVNHPSHYKTAGKEVYQMMQDIWGTDLYIAFCEMNSFKYRMRAGKKPGQPMEQDLQKAQWYENQVNKLRNERQESNDLPDNISTTGGAHYDVRYGSNED